MQLPTDLRNILILIVLCAFFFILGNGLLELTEPDEVFYTQTAREMVQKNTWMVPYLFGQPQFEKPILTYWLLRIGFIIFGVNSFSARFFPAFFALIGVLAVYWLGILAWKERKKAFLCALILASGGLYIGMARTVFTDMIFSVFVFLSMACFWWGYTRPERKGIGLILFFIFAALAVLTKGPLGIAIPFLAVFLFLALRRELKFLNSTAFLWGFLLFLLLAIPWHIFMIQKYGRSFINEFFYNDHIRRLLVAEHPQNDSWYFYPGTMVFCMFPWSLFVAASLWLVLRKLKEPLYLYLFSWIMVTFVIFQSAHSKLVSYIIPSFVALAMLAGDYIWQLWQKREGALKILLLVTMGVFFLFPVALIVSTFQFSKYITDKQPVILFAGFLALLLALNLIFILRRRFFAGLLLLTLPLPLMLYFFLFSHAQFEGYVSSKSACDYLMQNYHPQTTIISSKVFVRGVRFNTDKDVAVLSMRGSPFFSKHPIPFLHDDADAIPFLKSQPVTYGILNKAGFESAERLARENNFKFELLKKIADKYIVRIK